MGNRINTDAKLLALLDGGRRFAAIIDPDGIAAGCALARLSVNAASGKWSAKFRHQGGACFHVCGALLPDSSPVIELIRQKDENGQFADIAGKPSKTLKFALGALNRLPVRLSALLRPTGAAGGKETKSGDFLAKYLELVRRALVWGVEPARGHEPGTEFDLYRVEFFDAPPGSAAARAELSMTCQLDEGDIVISADADVFGLGAKKVTLRKNLGLLRSAVVDCRASHKGHGLPSLKVAFDLYELIPVLYEEERTLKLEFSGKAKAGPKKTK